MRLLDRYLLVEWLKAFGLSMAAMIGVLLLANLYSEMGDLLRDGAHPREVFVFYAVLLPGLLPAVIPLSQLVSLLYVFGSFHRHNEIIAMRAAGISLWRIARPVWLAGGVLAVVLGLLNAYAAPQAIEKSRLFRQNLRYAAERRANPGQEVGMVPQLTYYNRAEHRRWFINRFSEEAYRAHGVQIYQLDENGYDVSHILARDGYYDDAAECWVLKDGREVFFRNNGTEVVRSKPFDEMQFKAHERPAVMLTLRQHADDLSLNELRHTLALAGAEDNPAMDSYAVRYYSTLAKPFICLIVVGLAVPFAVAGVRTSPMVGVSKAVGLFFANYVVSGICTHLGDQHTVPALVAAWLPIVIMLGLAAWLFRRAA